MHWMVSDDIIISYSEMAILLPKGEYCCKKSDQIDETCGEVDLAKYEKSIMNSVIDIVNV